MAGDEVKVGAPIIFLDVDGVLVCSRSLLCDYDEEDPSLVPDPTGLLIFISRLFVGCYRSLSRIGEVFAPIELRCLQELRDLILAVPGARIVVSSTWRASPSMFHFLLYALDLAGIRSAFLGVTSTGTTRGQEVRLWLNAHPNVSHFVVLDDEHMDSFRMELPPGHVVRTVLDHKARPEDEGLAFCSLTY